jgi:uncharacterized protein YbjQ (UPF0145 family)
MAIQSRFKTREEYEAWKRSREKTPAPPMAEQFDPDLADVDALFERACALHDENKSLDIAYMWFMNILTRFPNAEQAPESRSRAEDLAAHLGVNEVDIFQAAANDKAERAAREVAREAEEERRQREAIKNVIVATTPMLDGYVVKEYKGIVTTETVYGVGFVTELFAHIDDALGGRSRGSESTFRRARQRCIAALALEADRLDANAVIGVDLDYGEISGQSKSMLFLVASGTAVVVEPREP